MKVTTTKRTFYVFWGIIVALSLGFSIDTVVVSAQSKTKKEKLMTQKAIGTFEVKLTPQTDDSADTKLGRMTIDKQFHGDIEANSKGQMLTGMTDEKGSAGYVAIELVTGTLKGRKGSFILQHTGIMDRGKPSLSVVVVPDSGTDELKGISGKMNIIIEGGKHSYEFEYTLPKTN
jgi:Protein of unknown function (DUF3224)